MKIVLFPRTQNLPLKKHVIRRILPSHWPSRSNLTESRFYSPNRIYPWSESHSRLNLTSTPWCDLALKAIIYNVITVTFNPEDALNHAVKRPRALALAFEPWIADKTRVLSDVSELHREREIPPRKNFTNNLSHLWQIWLVFGHIGTDFCNQICTLQYYLTSTVLSSWNFKI